MTQPLAIMFTLTTYGTWLRGDRRGWVDDAIVFPPDPELEARDQQRMKHPPLLFDRDQLIDIGWMIGRSLQARLEAVIHAMTVQVWHVHIVTAWLSEEFGEQAKCMKDAVRWGLRPGRPIWSVGYDKRFCFDPASVHSRIGYVRKHNPQIGFEADPWPFIVPYVG